MSGLFVSPIFKLNQIGSVRIKVNPSYQNRNKSGKHHFQQQHLCTVNQQLHSRKIKNHETK